MQYREERDQTIAKPSSGHGYAKSVRLCLSPRSADYLDNSPSHTPLELRGDTQGEADRYHASMIGRRCGGVTTRRLPHYLGSAVRWKPFRCLLKTPPLHRVRLRVRTYMCCIFPAGAKANCSRATICTTASTRHQSRTRH